jgi:hypothetical protein
MNESPSSPRYGPVVLQFANSTVNIVHVVLAYLMGGQDLFFNVGHTVWFPSLKCLTCGSINNLFLTFPRYLSILLLQTGKTDNNALDIDAIYNLKFRKTYPNSTESSWSYIFETYRILFWLFWNFISRLHLYYFSEWEHSKWRPEACKLFAVRHKNCGT